MNNSKYNRIYRFKQNRYKYTNLHSIRVGYGPDHYKEML